MTSPTAARTMEPRRVCLVTTTQPSTNPRLVKEADALAEAGFDVCAIGAYRADWACESDARLLASRAWRFTLIDFRREVSPALFWKTRIRHKAAVSLSGVPLLRRVVANSAASRVTPELARAAREMPADLYIAHNLGALPAAAAAARLHGARLGFDAEDFHRGEDYATEDRRRYDVICDAERTYLPRCDYVTAASPLIADQYVRITGGRAPVCVLNVFPLADRPASFRPSPAGGPLRLYWFSQTIGGDRGLDDVVGAMALVRDFEIELNIRGSWQPGYRDRLLSMADAAGVRRDRIVCHEPAAPDEMVRLASAYDVGLALERGAGLNNDLALSNKVFTYLLAGLAVVATRTRAQAALARDLGDAAVTYRPGAVADLADALRAWAGNRDRLAAARAAAWRLGETTYNWDKEKEKFLGIVRSVLCGRTSPWGHISEVTDSDTTPPVVNEETAR